MSPENEVRIKLHCNNFQDGSFLGYCTGIECGRLETACWLDDFSPSIVFGQASFVLEGERYACFFRERHVGELSCDLITSTAADVCRLLNWARANDFDWKGKVPGFGEIWDSGQPFQPVHLDLLFVDPCPKCGIETQHNGLMAWCDRGHNYSLSANDPRYSLL